MPTGLVIQKSDEANPKTYLEFDKVADATNYKVFIDGKEIRFESCRSHSFCKMRVVLSLQDDAFFCCVVDIR